MARIAYLTQSEIDHGAVACLPQECDAAGMRRPLLVTDPGVRAAGVEQQLQRDRQARIARQRGAHRGQRAAGAVPAEREALRIEA